VPKGAANCPNESVNMKDRCCSRFRSPRSFLAALGVACFCGAGCGSAADGPEPAEHVPGTQPGPGTGSEPNPPSEQAAAKDVAVAEAMPETRIVEVGELSNSPPPPDCVAGLPALLPNCSPNDPTPRGLDCDGDGVLDYQVFQCDLATAERPLYFGGAFDCAPADPGLRHWVSRDEDGDGFGSGWPLCAGPGIPEGYIALDPESLSDCDDRAASVHPGAVDSWNDGVDTDCSGQDFPACDAMDPQSVLRVLPATVSCANGADLYLSSIAACGSRCLSAGALWGYVGNAGNGAASGPIRLGFRDSGGNAGSIEVMQGNLAPGSASQLFKVPFALITELELWIESDDCAPANDRYLFSNPIGAATCLY